MENMGPMGPMGPMAPMGPMGPWALGPESGLKNQYFLEKKCYKIPNHYFGRVPISPRVKPMDPGTIPIKSASKIEYYSFEDRSVAIHGDINREKMFFPSKMARESRSTPPQ